MLAAVAAMAVPASAAAAQPRAPERVDGQYIVVFKRSVDRPLVETENLEQAEGFESRLRYRRALKGFAARLSSGQVRDLRADPEVAFVTPDRRVQALGSVPLASGDTAPPGVRRMQAATATETRQASSANVAVIDTGIDLAHPDLNATDGKNCVGTGPAQDDEGHGTHVAGTIGARNDGAGVVGVAPGTRLFSVKVLGAQGGGTWSQIICGIDWVTATRTDADPSNDIAVANMSLGGPGQPIAPCSTTTDPLHRAICASTAAGVTYVVAAGNDGWDFDYPSVPDTPAAYPEVLTVTAMGDSDGRSGGTGGAPGCDPYQPDDRYASFSNFAATAAGRAHTIAGPGVCVTSTLPGGGYGTMSGTSMAAPHLAGAAALCIGEAGGAGPCAGLAPAQIVSKLRADAERYTAAVSGFGFSGDPLRPAGGAYFGYLHWAGIDGAAPAVTSFTPAAGATAVPTSTTVAVTFGEPMDRASAQAAFSLRRTTDGAAVAGSFSWSGNTMTFQPSAALAGGTGYTARVGTGARDAAGNTLAAEQASTFTTAAALTTVTAYPSATVIESGSPRAGSYSRLTADDDSYYEVNSTTSGTRTASWYGRVAGVSNDLASLRLTYKGRNSRTCSQTVWIWNWSTNAWALLDSRSVGTSEVLVDGLLGGTLADYVSGTSGDGEVRVRVRCTHGSSSFYARADLLRLTYTK
ncbi:MAG TPA: S8 family serine peptidase [Thermoleophilaceae bacterium]|nr:S8 family serine peptidase [Thermoleophilaceae bacterium]